MKKNKFNIISCLLFGLMILVLSGCFQMTQEYWHYSDGTGKIFMDMSISEELLKMGGSGATTTNPFADWDKPDNAIKKDPNIEKITVKEFSKDGEHHFTAELELKSFEAAVNSLKKPESGLDMNFSKLPNGNYKFSQVIKPGTGMNQPSDSGGEATTAKLFADKYWTIRLHIPSMVDSDPTAKYNKGTNTIEWKMPMEDLMKQKENTELWAEYSMEGSFSSSASSVPIWLIVIAALICLLSIVIVVIVIIILVVKKPSRKTPPPSGPPPGY